MQEHGQGWKRFFTKKKKSFKIPDEHVAGTCFAPPTSH